MSDAEFLFDKSYECPICDHSFKAKTVRTGKVRTESTDMDLRPRFKQVDCLKYEPVLCPKCGYAAMAKFFPTVLPVQKKLIKEKICSSFKERAEDHAEEYSYDVALERYKLALLNAMVKTSKSSESAYICLKVAWLYRGYGESLDTDAPDYADKKEKLEKDEMQFLRRAMDGFVKARMEEDYPMAGMDEATVDYLLAALGIECEEYDMAAKLLSGLLTSRSASARIKDKAHDLKDELTKRTKESE